MLRNFVALILFLASFSHATSLHAADLPSDATVLDPDIVWDVANPHNIAISRDGKQIAYISRGALWLCGVEAGPLRSSPISPTRPRRL